MNQIKKSKLKDLEDFNKYEKNDHSYYSHIVSIVDNWMKRVMTTD